MMNNEDGPLPPRAPAAHWKLRIAGWLIEARAGSPREWYQATAKITAAMVAALAALDRVGRDDFSDGDGNIVAAAEAANALVNLSGELLDLRDDLADQFDDDDQADDDDDQEPA